MFLFVLCFRCLQGYRDGVAMTKLEAAKALVDEQAEDDGLWFDAQTMPEAYLQQELRRLHSAIEDIT